MATKAKPKKRTTTLTISKPKKVACSARPATKAAYKKKAKVALRRLATAYKTQAKELASVEKCKVPAKKKAVKRKKSKKKNSSVSRGVPQQASRRNARVLPGMAGR